MKLESLKYYNAENRWKYFIRIVYKVAEGVFERKVRSVARNVGENDFKLGRREEGFVQEVLKDRSYANKRNVREVEKALKCELRRFKMEDMDEVAEDLEYVVIWYNTFDPAGPIYKILPPTQRLHRSDATFVDVVHTDVGLAKYGHFGIQQSLGDVDFYVNGGDNQPGCGRPGIHNGAIGFCSHWKSIKYFTDTIRGEQYVAYPCSNNQAIHHLHTMIPFGEHVPHSATGDFCLAVDRSEDRSPQKTAFQKLAESLPNIDLRSVIF
ncbi:uncharacterized protein LOC136029632 [Artemia franciscana]|uniref:uncharacterized protein LOC136029632 n=1 Tax=Artemia franciscana TaxID=6661 RepID=UPI0032DBDC30